MVHGFHPRQDFYFYPFIANSLRQGNLQNHPGIDKGHLGAVARSGLNQLGVLPSGVCAPSGR